MERNNNWESLNETPKYGRNYENLNETPDLSQYRIDENCNDGWNLDVQIETRINGEIVRNNDPYQPIRKRNRPDPNGLNQFMDDNLNEVFRSPEISNVNEVVSHDLFSASVVSTELFEKVNQKGIEAIVR